MSNAAIGKAGPSDQSLFTLGSLVNYDAIDIDGGAIDGGVVDAGAVAAPRTSHS
ncbi:MAG: hypothetical protein GY811_10120 [Myxococcales bacterium]|nr:hypothetical protein [Myxococcales bacterium]